MNLSYQCAHVTFPHRYASYRLVSEIAVQFYRTRDENKEFDARRRLMATISHMMTLQAI